MSKQSQNSIVSFPFIDINAYLKWLSSTLVFSIDHVHQITVEGEYFFEVVILCCSVVFVFLFWGVEVCSLHSFRSTCRFLQASIAVCYGKSTNRVMATLINICSNDSKMGVHNMISIPILNDYCPIMEVLNVSAEPKLYCVFSVH